MAGESRSPSDLLIAEALQNVAATLARQSGSVDELIEALRRQSATPEAAPVLPGLMFDGLTPTYFPTGQAGASPLFVDRAGRLRVTTGATLAMGEPVALTIPNGGTTTPWLPTPPEWTAAAGLILWDSPTRLAAEVISQDVGLTTSLDQAANIATDPNAKLLSANLLAATVGAAAGMNTNMRYFPAQRLRSAVAVGGNRTFLIFPLY